MCIAFQDGEGSEEVELGGGMVKQGVGQACERVGTEAETAAES